jgi:hypothetical protein
MIVNEFMSVASTYGVVATTNFGGIYGADGTKKKPDILVFRLQKSEGEGARHLLLDVSVPHQAERHTYNALTHMRNQKVLKYADYDPAADIEPLLVSTVGTMEARTAKMLNQLVDQLGIKRGFVRDLVARIKKAVIVFEAYRFKALQLKATTRDWVNVQTEE